MIFNNTDCLKVCVNILIRVETTSMEYDRTKYLVYNAISGFNRLRENTRNDVIFDIIKFVTFSFYRILKVEFTLNNGSFQ